jgi:hypothetical protein
VAIPDDHPMVKPIRDEGRYLQLFAQAGDAKIVGEASPTYLQDPEAPMLMSRAVPDAKILISLRDPVERLYSLYLMMLNSRPGLGTFAEEIERGLALQGDRSLALLRLDVGLYDQQVRRFRDVYGDQRLKILIFEEFMTDVPGTMRQILEFLGIEHEVDNFAAPVYRQFSVVRNPLVRYVFGNRNISRAAEALIPRQARKLIRDMFLVKQVPKPQMDPESREFLQRYYADDVRRLEDLLGRPLPWRNFTRDAATHPAA